MSDLCRILEWDSDFLGRNVARVEPTRLLPDQADEVRRWCDRHQVDCLYFLCEDEPVSVSQAERLGCHLVDVRMELQWSASCGVDGRELPPQLALRPYKPADLVSLEAIAAQAFTQTRFSLDERFGPDYAQRLYVQWVRRSCGGAETVLVAHMNGQVAGFITHHTDARQYARIGLLGVAEGYRGSGIGSALVRQVQRSLRDRGTAELRVVTQGRQIAAQRLYQACGFRSLSMRLWYHRWFSRPQHP